MQNFILSTDGLEQVHRNKAEMKACKTTTLVRNSGRQVED